MILSNRALLLVGTVTVVANACGDKSPKSGPAEAQAGAPVVKSAAYGDTASISARADSIDRYVDAHADRLVLFAKVRDRAELVSVKDTASWPEETTISYNTIADDSGRPLFHMQAPASESGDWSATEEHYFAPDGRTILWRFDISGFSSGCTSILREHRAIFLGPTGSVLAETRRYTDENDKPIAADSCYRRSDSAPAPKRSAADLPFLRR